MEHISTAAEISLRLLQEEFFLELANQSIGARHATKYASSDEATMAMLRLAYIKGRSDETARTTDFDAGVARVEAANNARR